MFNTFLCIIILIFKRCICCSHQLAAYALLYLCIYSVPAHKEFRFLLPALQLVMPYCGRGAAWMAAQTQKKQHPGRALALKILLPCIFISQLFVGLYFATVHQRYGCSLHLGTSAHIRTFTEKSLQWNYCRGQIRVTELIAQLGSSKSDLSVLYLTPCHATPYFSHMHRGNVSMRFLDCSPPGKYLSAYCVVDYRMILMPACNDH